MSWFKSRKDKDKASGSKTSLDKAVTPEKPEEETPSYDEARRALRASLNLEVDDPKPVAAEPDVSKEETLSPDTSSDSDQPAADVSAPSFVENPNDQVTFDFAPKEEGEEVTEKDEPEGLVDSQRLEDIQSILSKIEEAKEQVAEEAAAATQDNPSHEVLPGEVLKDNLLQTSKVEETPEPPAYDITEITTTAVTEEPSTLPPASGSLADPDLGKAAPSAATLSKSFGQVQKEHEVDASHIPLDDALEKYSQMNDYTPPDSVKAVMADEEEPNKEENAMDHTSIHTADIDVKSEDASDENLASVTPAANTGTSSLSAELTEAPGLEIKNLGKSYKKRPVLTDVSLNVKRGEAVGLLGPNGAGKTTCFYMVCGLIPADIGQIMLDGQDITVLPMYRRARMGIGYLPQEASIFRGLTVEQNIRAVLEAVESNRDEREAMLDSLLEEFSISHLRRSPAVALSGGERRRLEIARALATQPHFILLDEPLAGIDPIAVRDIRQLVSHLKNRGLGVLITDHNVRETLGIVDRAYILHDGRVLMEGKPDEIVGNEEVRRVYLGDEFSR